MFESSECESDNNHLEDRYIPKENYSAVCRLNFDDIENENMMEPVCQS